MSRQQILKTLAAVLFSLGLASLVRGASPLYLVLATTLALEPSAAPPYRALLRRVYGAAVGVAVGTVFGTLFGAGPIVAAGAITLAIGACLGFGFREASRFALLAVAALLLPLSPHPWHFALARMLELVLGIGAGAVAERLSWPLPSKAPAHGTPAELLLQLGRAYELALQGYFSGSYPPHEVGYVLSRVPLLLGALEEERGPVPPGLGSRAALSGRLRQVWQEIRLLDRLAREGHHDTAWRELAPELPALVDAGTAAFRRAAARLDGAAPPVLADLPQALAALQARRGELQARWEDSYPMGELLRLGTLLGALELIASGLLALDGRGDP